MEAKTLLLLNAASIVVISFATDNWIQVSYSISAVPDYCTLHQMPDFHILQCSTDRRLINPQYSNLFRQCNDLTGPSIFSSFSL
ncbi:unnamed protein product [Gongylonema pulchrum]|uniref:Secreted protein n=1 Tax=Gongylonema pulchrum TaxID=637853 RepID=A0A183EV50_9BILA|nr:unnamed protein product [Gongylonema pulchrum]